MSRTKEEINSIPFRLKQFDAVVACAELGAISVDSYHSSIEKIMQRSVWIHELGYTGLKHLRLELEGKETFSDPITSLIKIKSEVDRSQIHISTAQDSNSLEGNE